MAKTIELEQSPFERAQQGGLVGAAKVASATVCREAKKTSERGMRKLQVPGTKDIGYRHSSKLSAQRIECQPRLRRKRMYILHVCMQLRRDNEGFRKQWNEAAEIGTELLEQEAQRRAFHGTLKPVFYKGVEVRQHTRV